MSFFLMMTMTFISLFMLFITPPLKMGLMILIQTLLLSLLLGIYINTYWFSYILFLVFLGGLLVLFIYVSSVASNEMMNFSLKMKMYLLFSIIMFILFSIFKMKNYYLFNNFINNEMNNFNEYFLFFNENKISLSKLYNSQTFLMIMMIIIYLFITLIAVIKITNIFFGPLRSFN
uniref:NADH-ubiquinone oxidoreductase chain 6 n=1 Tax=Pontia daplidice TaxID=441325 RepID=A0A5Q0MVT8_9NEOP|nr:NADH dehydrogenase subunit 6 [Pontia daplidice]QFZ96424.1 NADH dehydrogenase subunit 6 [Pontia daplidice]